MFKSGRQSQVTSHKSHVTSFLCLVSCVLVFAFFSLVSTPAHAFWFWGHTKKAVPAALSPSGELSLDEAYALALKRSEDLAIHAEDIQAAQGRFYRAFQYFLPNVSYQFSRFQQDAPEALSSSSVSNSSRPVTNDQQFVFTQPIFTGFKQFAAIQGSGADKKEQRFRYERARQLLFVDVVNAYYNLLQAVKDQEILASTRQLLGKRMMELAERVKIGKSRQTEMASGRSDLKAIDADLVDARRAVRVARNLLEFYIGQPLGDRTLVDLEPKTDLGDASVYLPLAAKRPDVTADEQAYVLAKANLLSARGGFFPTVSATGDYYTKREGFQNGNDWDVTLTASIPIFDGAQTIGNVKEASAQSEQARLQFESTRRKAELDIRDSLEELRSSEEGEAALRDASLAAKQSYDDLSQEYRLNLVNNLEVLDSLDRLETIDRRYNDSHFQAVKNYWIFKVSLGEVASD